MLSSSSKFFLLLCFVTIKQWVRLNYATTKLNYIHYHPPPPTDNQNISTATNNNPKYIQVGSLFYKKNIKIFYSKVNDEKHFD